MKKLNNREKQLLAVVDDLLWMAARYAHGRQTFAPHTVRQCVALLRSLYPDFKIKHDHVITPPEEPCKGIRLRSDWLDDIFNPFPAEGD